MRRNGLMISVLVVAVAASAAGVAVAADPTGRTTVQTRILGSGAPAPYRTLAFAPGESHVVREERIATAQPGREQRRRSLLYFGQLSDTHVIDEESPARVEFTDPIGPPFTSAFRPQEAFSAQVADQAVRQLNRFAGASPVAAGDGSRARMALTITTGDSADNQQRNETEWIVGVLEGGTIDPNSGRSDTARWPTQCLALSGLIPAAEAPRYTGVQDYDDYEEGPLPVFYDPDDPRAIGYAAWPSYPGLMDRAQRPFVAEGLATPSYVTFGNHDGLVQGNQAANVALEAVSTGCVKPFVPTLPITDPASIFGGLTAANLQGLLATQPGKVGLVPPDERRQFVSKEQYRKLHQTAAQADGHGFGFVDPAELAASKGAASYYAWTPKPGVRMISVDTVSEGGIAGPSADGNLDEPQFRWLERELAAATARDEIVILFSHHAIPSLTSPVPDEAGGPCLLQSPAFGHDINPGCDVDPRTSTPIRLADDVTALIHRYPHAVAWVAGHSHVNKIEPYVAPSGRGGFWGVRVASEIDWPQQARLIDLMDNRDGTLSLFGTVVDHSADTDVPAPGTPAAGLTDRQLSSISRVFSYNDPQGGGNAAVAPVGGEGGAKDRNVELLVPDPRRSSAGVRADAACAAATGRIARRTIGRVTLGRRRATVRRRFAASAYKRERRTIDRFCLRGGGHIRVGFPSTALRRKLPARERRRVRGRAVLALTTRTRYSARGIRAGTHVATLRRKFRRSGLRRARIGRTTWYLARGKRARVVFRMRGRRAARVAEAGLADLRLTRGSAAARRFLASFR